MTFSSSLLDVNVGSFSNCNSGLRDSFGYDIDDTTTDSNFSGESIYSGSRVISPISSSSSSSQIISKISIASLSSEIGYDDDDTTTSSSSSFKTATSSLAKSSSSEIGYDDDDTTTSSGSEIGYSVDDESEKSVDRFEDQFAYNPSKNEGPREYVALSPREYFVKRKRVFSALETADHEKLMRTFYRGIYSNHSDSWAIEALDMLTTRFGPMSMQSLGAGSNSGVFVIENKDSEKKQIFRVFSIQGLRDPNFSKSYRLDKNRVGGEWLNMAVSHPNVAANSHILVWDSSRGFNILDRSEAQALMESHDQFEEGREIYAVATIGDFVEGSVDLDQLKGKTFSSGEIKTILQGLFMGIAASHEEDICHRDLKPSNVILLPSGEAQIIDFGSSNLEMPNLRMSRGGDFVYHPPENIFTSEKRSGKKADSYGLFRIIYHLVTGKDYFEGIQNAGPASVRFNKLSQTHKELLEKEVQIGFKGILEEDPNLNGVDPELMDLMCVTGTGLVSKRMLPEAALQMSYFRE